MISDTPLGARRTVTISRVKLPWLPFFRIFIFFDEVFNTVCGTTYLMRDDGATVANVRPLHYPLATLKCKVFPKKPYGPFGPALGTNILPLGSSTLVPRGVVS